MGDEVSRATAEDGALVRKLKSVSALTDEECAALASVPMMVRNLAPHAEIVGEGDRPEVCCLVLSGFACRYKLMRDGQRQILAFHIPGDIPDLQSLHLPRLDHHLSALTAVTAGFIRHEAIHDLNRRFPRLAGALWRETLVDASIGREWIVSLGQREAMSRIAHLMCEMFTRMKAVGRTDGLSMVFPFKQPDLADTLGLSTVHTNRSLQKLRARNLISLKASRLDIQNWAELANVADFDPLYLHLGPDDRPSPP